MLRTVFLVCVVLGTLVHINSALIDLSSLQPALGALVNTTDTILIGVESVINSEVTSLNKALALIPQIDSLLNGLLPNLLGVISKVAPGAVSTVKNAVDSILTAVSNIKSTVSGAISLLKDIVTALGPIVEEVVALVQSVLALVGSLLGGLTTSLQTALQGALAQLSDLGNVIVSKLGGALGNLLKTVDSNINTIVGVLQNKLLPKITSLSNKLQTEATSALINLLHADNLISSLVQSVLAAVFALVGTLTTALQGLANPLLDTVTTTLGQIAACPLCLLTGGIGRRRRAIA